MKAMIFAAGLGTRLKPITNTKPKALAEINGVPLLEITIKRLIRFGFDNIIVNVHHFPNQIVDFLKTKNNFGIHIELSDETGLLLDTGGGLKKASNFFNQGESFLVHNVDIVSNIDLEELFNAHLKNNSLVTLACMERESSRQFLINSTNELCGWKNNKTGEIKISREKESFLKPISFCGIQVVNPKMLDLITETGSFSLIDLYLRLARNYTIKTEIFNKITWLDLGTPETLQKACGLKKELGL